MCVCVCVCVCVRAWEASWGAEPGPACPPRADRYTGWVWKLKVNVPDDEPSAAGAVSVRREALTLRSLCGIWHTHTHIHAGRSRPSRAHAHTHTPEVHLSCWDCFLVWSRWQVTRHHVQEKDQVHRYNAAETSVSRRLSFTTRSGVFRTEFSCCAVLRAPCRYLPCPVL